MTEVKLHGAIHAVAESICNHMQDVTTKDSEAKCQLKCLIDALYILGENINY